MSNTTKYVFQMDPRFSPLDLIDIPKLAEECRETWFNQTLGRVNDCVVRLGILQGEFHWHLHDVEDEFFYVVSGALWLDLEERSVELKPNQGLVVPRGVRHRTRAPQRTVVLMMEGSGVKPEGDGGM
ncbi:MAG: cupin domain-containing protein [Calditrichota bacterium]